MLLIARLPLLAALVISAGESAESTLAQEREASEDRKLLQSAGAPLDGPGLLAFFSRQELTAAEEKQFAAVLRRLADRAFKVRNGASAELIARGPAVLPLLRRGLPGTDLETRRRIEHCIRHLERLVSREVTVAAARRLLRLRPVGAAAVLVGQLCRIEDEETQEELLGALFTLAAEAGKPDPGLVSALRHPARQVRATAALLVGRFGDAGQRAAVGEVLRGDLFLSVRLRAAEGLLGAGDTAAMPVLLAILREGNAELAREAEQLLRQAAGKGAPVAALGEGAARRKCCDAWEAWWQRQREKIPLEKGQTDVFALNARRRARDVVGRLIAAVARADMAGIRATTAIPFKLAQQGQTFRTRAEFDAFLEKNLKNSQEELIVTTMRVVRLIDFAAQVSAAGREFLRDVSQPGVFVVVIQLKQEAGRVGVPVFVRVRGAGARVIAIGDERHLEKNP